MTERTQSQMSLLQAMFPSVDLAVISMILETSNNDTEKASELLLDMTDVSSSVPDTSNTELWPSIQPPAQSSSPARRTNIVSSSPRHSPGAKTSKSSSLGAIASKISVSKEDAEAIACCHEQLQSNQRVLVIMRGLPGSGKSTLAKRIVNEAKVGVVLSTDDYFMRNGQYIFRPEELSNAHKANHDQAAQAVRNKVPLVVIDNTNTQSWEMRPYFELGVANSYKIQILEPSTDWKFKPKMLTSRNSHGVPRHSIENMMDRYEKNLTVDTLLALWNLKEKEAQNHRECEVETIQLFTDDSEANDIYTSDPESEEEIDEEGREDETSSELSLNPEVKEFVPVSVSASTIPDSAEEQSINTEPGADYEAFTEHDEMAKLMNLFPALSVEEVTEMYESQTINMRLDPSFAESLQNYFGSPAPPDYLTKLPQEQMLSLDISLSVAKAIFLIWQQNVLTKLNDDKYLVPGNKSDVRDIPNIPDIPTHNATVPSAPAKTVMAPNAASLNSAQKKTPLIVVKDEASSGSAGDTDESLSNLDIEQLIEERDSLYRKAAETRGAHMQGASSYYAARARELNTIIKSAQKEKQMEMFLTINKGIPKTRIDLHYLQTGEAIKQLQKFVGQWESFLTLGKKPSQALEIVTGRGNRSDNGKSRLRPAVAAWLTQKNYQYSEVNDGCYKVTLKPRKN